MINLNLYIIFVNFSDISHYVLKILPISTVTESKAMNIFKAFDMLYMEIIVSAEY